MKIKKLHITNFKSIKDLELINPNPFSVFVGPNGAGKSNIFEALEFAVYLQKQKILGEAIKLFDGAKSIFRFQANDLFQNFHVETERRNILDQHVAYRKVENYGVEFNNEHSSVVDVLNSSKDYMDLIGGKSKLMEDYNQIVQAFNRIFLNNPSIKRISRNDDTSLNTDGSNLEKVLRKVFQDNNNRLDIIEWLQVLVPEFKNIEISAPNLSGDISYEIYEKYSDKPFHKRLVSDGTKNILALLTAVYQSDEPQFLCIEEPENGLHPYVIESLVSFFRTACKEKGHYIWLNTHSQTLARQLTVDEIIVVDKKEGATRVRQFQERNLHGLPMDEAWLTNALGGGLP